MSKISVIIPIYNEEVSILDECLNSVQNQSLKDIEIICIIDKLNSPLFQFLKNKSQSDNRIKVLKQRHQGSGAARNKGIKNANGEFIAFLDSDDYFADEFGLEHLYKNAIDHNVNISGGKVLNLINNNLEAPFWRFKNFENLFTNRLAHIYDFQICWGYWCFIYKREFLIENKLFFPNLLRYQDPPWFLKTLHRAKFFYASDKVIYIHREKNIEKIWTDKMIKDYINGIREVLIFSKKHDFKDLHTFIYRKFLTYDIKKIQDKNVKSIFLSKTNLFNKIFKAIDKKIITDTDKNIPIFNSYKDYFFNIHKFDLIDF